MRVTNSMLVSNFMNNINNNLNKLGSVQDQMATGKKFAHISDDPVSVIYAQQARQRLNRLEHYQHTVDTAQNWLKQAETAILELNEVIKSAYESTIDAATNVKTDADLEKMSHYMKELRDHALSTLNSAFGTKFVFGGYNTTGVTDPRGLQEAPFTVDDDGHLIYSGCDLTDTSAGNVDLMNKLREDLLTFDVGPGIEMPVTINGIEVAVYNAGGDNIYGVLDDLFKAVERGAEPGELEEFIPKLKEIQEHLLGQTAEIGGRTNRLDILTARYEQDEINYSQMKSDAEDADMSEVIMNYKMAESVYKAALATGAYIIQPTLMDFLR